MMDTPITQPWWQRRRVIRAAVVIAVGALLLATGLSFRANAQRTITRPIATLTVSKVLDGVYHDSIPVRGKVVPRDTIYLDALEGGRVDKVLVEPGDFVTAGQPLVELSNTELELDVLDREARLIESMTQLQSYQTQLEQNRLSNEKALELIDYNIVRLSRAVERHNKLAAEGLVAKEIRDSLQDELDYTNSLRPLQGQSNREQTALRDQQMPQINAQLKKLQDDMEITRGKLGNLTVRAPVSGRMTAIDLKVGENRNRGDRLGEITLGTGYKLSASIDEYYLGRVAAGQTAAVQIGSAEAQLRVIRVYPQVRDGKFAVDLDFESTSDGLLPGQTLQGKLGLGGDSHAIILPAGAFLETTGGDWVFALAKNGKSAERRKITLGRRNSEQIEVLTGLQAGDLAITSAYTGLDRIERINLRN